MERDEKVRILYIEDDAGYAKLFQKKIQPLGYDVEVARNGEEGIAMFDTGSYDIVLVDYGLPDCDGLQVIERLSLKGIATPLIMITGIGSEEIAVRAMKTGASDYVVKDMELMYLSLLPSIMEKAIQQQEILDAKLKAEASLRASEERLNSILSSLDDFMFVIDKNGIVVDYHRPANMTADPLLCPKRFLGKSFQEALPRSLCLLVHNAIKLVETNLLAQQFDFQMETATRKLWLNAKVSPRKGYDDEYAGVTILARDISARRRMEEIVKDNEKRLQILFDSAPDGYFLSDMKGTLLDVNKTAEMLAGYKKKELIGKR